ncbi:hypothetical protein BH23GEM7_BH23GEM7_09230 [soil metagenome]
MSTQRALLTLLVPAGLALAAVTFVPPSPVDALSAVTAPTAQPALLLARSPLTAEIRLAVAPTGNQVRYRVREQLVGRDLPNDAVGETNQVTGAIVIGEGGNPVSSRSRIVVNVTQLTSDQSRRDGYVQRRLLETEQFPTVELVPTGLRGLSWPLPTTGARTFEMIGNLTVRGVTRPTTWRVTAQFTGDRVTGTAVTGFTFDDFELTQPRVPILLSVADSIRLEYDFNLTRERSATP